MRCGGWLLGLLLAVATIAGLAIRDQVDGDSGRQRMPLGWCKPF